MGLSTGVRVGPYEITGKLGAGGMGEVYRGRDTRLPRDVAIKIVAPGRSVGVDRHRFQREAAALAALNHPHICTLYDVGEFEGEPYFVCELINGETLADRLRRGPLSVDEVLTFGAQLAAALHHAHRAGVLHRDIKPQNVMLTRAGAKLLDFGVARPASSSTADTRTASMDTSPGVIVGTPHYLAPEQVKGEPATIASDIFAFGVLLYEMCTAQRAFDGPSTAAIYAAILSQAPPPVRARRPEIPPRLEQLIDGCLHQDPDQRVQSAHDLKLQLEWMRQETGPAPSAASRWPSAFAIAMLAIAVMVVGMAFAVRNAGNESVPVHLDLASDRPVTNPPAISQDGRRIAYITAAADFRDARLWIRDLTDGSLRSIDGADGASYPFFSPDGQAIGFFAAQKLKRVATTGGPVTVLADAPAGRGGAWNSRGDIVFAPNINSPVLEISASGGATREITRIDGRLETGHRYPAYADDGRVVFLAAGAAGQPSRLQLLSRDDGSVKTITTASSKAEYADGRLYFAIDGRLVAQPLDLRTATLGGDPTPVGGNPIGQANVGAYLFGVSRTTVALVPPVQRNVVRQFSIRDRAGKVLDTIGEPMSVDTLAVVPAHNRAVATINSTVVLVDLTRKTFTPVTALNAATAAISPDGLQVAYTAPSGFSTAELRSMSLTQPGTSTLLAEDRQAPSFLVFGWTVKGDVIFTKAATVSRHTLWRQPARGGAMTAIRDGSSRIADASPSPDGEWVAYADDVSGRYEAYLERIGQPGRRWQVSVHGGSSPRWHPQQTELIFLSPNGTLMSVQISLDDQPTLGLPRELFATKLQSDGNLRAPYGVLGPDRFLIGDVIRDERIVAPMSVIVNPRPRAN